MTALIQAPDEAELSETLNTTALAIETFTRLEELEGLRAEWSELCDRSLRCTPFQRPEWLIPWCRQRRPDELWVLVVRRGAQLVGLAPFWLQPPSARPVGRPPGRALGILGVGVSDYLDIVLDPRFARTASAAVFSHLDVDGRWDFCDFRQLRPEAELLAADFPDRWSEQRIAAIPSPVLVLPKRVDLLPRVVSARQHKNFAQFRRRLARQGVVRTTTSNRKTCVEDFAELVRLHELRWRRPMQPMALAFHREVVIGFARRQTLALHLLHLDDRVIAAYYGLVERKRAYFYLQGFDPEFAKWSPGVLMVGFAIEEAVRQGLETFDFLRGAETYKYRWGARDVSSLCRRLWRPSGS